MVGCAQLRSHTHRGLSKPTSMLAAAFGPFWPLLVSFVYFWSALSILSSFGTFKVNVCMFSLDFYFCPLLLIFDYTENNGSFPFLLRQHYATDLGLISKTKTSFSSLSPSWRTCRQDKQSIDHFLLCTLSMILDTFENFVLSPESRR